MTYIDYRRRLEFGDREFTAIDSHCRERCIAWFASCWDEESVDFISRFEPPCFKAASASLTDHALLRRMKAAGAPLMLSTGMSTAGEIEEAVSAAGRDRLLLAHSTSSYPCPVGELNLRMLHTLRRAYPECPVGYSGHETGLSTTWAAVALGATFVERHITLDRALWGTDQAASVEVGGFMRLVSNIRSVERALGDGVKRVYASELPQIEKLRRVRTAFRAAS
jgi:N-acetylneuraminate synthase